MTIKKAIQDCGLDVGIIYFILKDILKEIEQLYYGQINRELSDKQKNQNNEAEENK